MHLQSCFARTGVDPLSGAFVPGREAPRGHGPSSGAHPERIREAFSEWAPQAFLARKDKPLCLYVHVPFCRHRCLFCPFYKNRSTPGFSRDYSELLVREIELTVAVLGSASKKRQVAAIYFGGGTPSDLAAADLMRVLESLRAGFEITTETEVTVEGRVRGFSAEKAEAWVAAGANRFSVGLQSTDTTLRRRYGRLADRDEIRSSFQELGASGAVLIADLIYGLCGQTVASIEEDIRFLSEETPLDGLDLYKLKLFPGSPLEKAVEGGRLPAVPPLEVQAAMYGQGSVRLSEFAFEHFTPRHWRRRERERSIYNRMAQSDADILPFGSSAGGRIGEVSLMQERNLDRYGEAIRADDKTAACWAMRSQSPHTAFRHALTEALQRRELPPLLEWPETVQNSAERVLQNWHEAGLIANPLNDSATQPRLTTAGSFWADHLEKLSLSLVL